MALTVEACQARFQEARWAARQARWTTSGRLAQAPAVERQYREFHPGFGERSAEVIQEMLSKQNRGADKPKSGIGALRVKRFTMIRSRPLPTGKSRSAPNRNSHLDNRSASESRRRRRCGIRAPNKPSMSPFRRRAGRAELSLAVPPTGGDSCDLDRGGSAKWRKRKVAQSRGFGAIVGAIVLLIGVAFRRYAPGYHFGLGLMRRLGDDIIRGIEFRTALDLARQGAGPCDGIKAQTRRPVMSTPNQTMLAEFLRRFHYTRTVTFQPPPGLLEANRIIDIRQFPGHAASALQSTYALKSLQRMEEHQWKSLAIFKPNQRNDGQNDERRSIRGDQFSANDERHTALLVEFDLKTADDRLEIRHFSPSGRRRCVCAGRSPHRRVSVPSGIVRPAWSCFPRRGPRWSAPQRRSRGHAGPRFGGGAALAR